MALALVRVDDRLVHGQVVEGWLRVVQAGIIVVACDEAAGDDFQACLMRLAVPADVQVKVLKLAETAEIFKRGDWAKERVLLLVSGVQEVCRLVDLGVGIESVNVGGLHDCPGRKMITPSLFLGKEDEKALRVLLCKKITVETRALPNDELHYVGEYLNKKDE